MKTNISELMNIIADEEKKFVNITSYIEERIFNETIIELDGRVNVIKDYKKDFEEAMKEQEDILKKISKLKALYMKKTIHLSYLMVELFKMLLLITLI